MTRAMTRAIMFQGTGSDVGKTVLVAGLCRLARRRGLSVRPFKPQNMSNNAAVAAIPETGGEGEIGRAQWLQALACGVAPNVHMNPVLLKPQSGTGSQIVVQGKVWGSAEGRDYQKLKVKLMASVMESWTTLSWDADLILVEGAGSPAEINLRPGDIANMGFARQANCPVILVGDVDRGGVIASLVGTHTILAQEDRKMVAGYLINKFRGDVSLFDDALTAIADFTTWPCFGVVPWLQAASKLPAEDSVALDRLMMMSGPPTNAAAQKKVAVPVLGRIANFDDFDPLIHDSRIETVFVKAGNQLPQDADLVILPGSKSTIADLAAFRENGWDSDLNDHRRRGGSVIGICGGYQMLGKIVRDPGGVEGPAGEATGLGLLDIETMMEPEKQVRSVTAWSPLLDRDLSGYEIHIGTTTGRDCARPVALIGDRPDGAASADGKVFGTYLHGALGSVIGNRILFPDDSGEENSHTEQTVDQSLDEIASELDRHVDFDGLLKLAR